MAKHRWYMKFHTCFLSLQGVMVSVSVLTLSVISVERWYAICHPLKFKTTTTRVRLLIISIWIVAVLLLVPDIVVLHTERSFPEEFTIMLTACKPRWEYHSQMAYELFKMIALFFLPLCLMACTYGQIVRCLWSIAIPTEPGRGTTAPILGLESLWRRRPIGTGIPIIKCRTVLGLWWWFLYLYDDLFNGQGP